ncbi:MAG: histidinol-phosphatase HisJ family protein [Ruminococcaceae bacterium]|nr:histidinol-phosphatase HisJ family protein [Oscillospiraceae bacterium]
MDFNYHTHTYRCHHATGKDEEYVKRAIEGGIKYMGFSDHIPFICADGFESGYRVTVNEAQEYVESISALREKYKDKIDIKIGFETEYYPEDFEKMVDFVKKIGAEYLILGQHYLGNEHYGGNHSIIPTDKEEDIKRYVSLVISAMESGYITYIAHPDMFNFTGDIELYRKEMRKICIASREHNVPLEINFLGIYDGRNYPNENFWKLAGEEQCPVTFGFDAHNPERAYDEKSLQKAEEIVKKYNLNFIGKPEIKPIQEI